jgi:hypothetical protein
MAWSYFNKAMLSFAPGSRRPLLLRGRTLFGKEAYNCMVAADVLVSLEYVDFAKLGGIGPAHN